MMGNTSEDHDSFESSLVLWEDGSVTARYGYDSAVRRLHEYEVSTGQRTSRPLSGVLGTVHCNSSKRRNFRTSRLGVHTRPAVCL